MFLHENSKAVAVAEQSQVAEARREARNLAASIGLSESDRERVSIVATEMATNLVKHTPGGGALIAGVLPGRSGIQLMALDKGPGMDIERCIPDGFSTAGSAGTGLGAIRRLSSVFDAYSFNSGTVVLSHIYAKGEQPGKSGELDVGAVSVPMAGEEVCGDGWEVWQNENRCVAMVVDGLGHGVQAYDAAMEARRIFSLCAGKSGIEVLENIHAALQKTRGGAAAVADIDIPGQTVSYTGAGNISALVVGNTMRSMVSMNGTVGVGTLRAKAFSYAWEAGGMLIMFSDGISTHWKIEDYPGLRNRHAATIAGVIYRDYGRGRDDATVLVVKSIN
ncbi:MAG TPA: SpoIIE family protein phosphatase [Planctomycetota bacterium]|nr:SpoIIE family protein phosphatase [Planctomycetota bacterium]